MITTLTYKYLWIFWGYRNRDRSRNKNLDGVLHTKLMKPTADLNGCSMRTAALNISLNSIYVVGQDPRTGTPPFFHAYPSKEAYHPF